jgi:hypothetical protein
MNNIDDQKERNKTEKQKLSAKLMIYMYVCSMEKYIKSEH